jgi:hypothetical protein
MDDQKDMATPFLARLFGLLGGRGTAVVYPCIADLVENGRDAARFAAGEWPPNRQDVTQYLAAWSRHAGLSEEESRGWLIDYCKTKLAAISSRTPAAIAHSTKSNLRYIYKSAVPFVCQFEKNRFRARCSTACPFYPQMQEILRVRAAEALNPKPVAPPPVIQVVLPVKAAHRPQFEAAMRFASAEAAKGTKPKRIVELLKAQGLKTRTGREWRYAILRSELQKWRWKHPPVSAPDDPAATGSLDAGPGPDAAKK